MNIVSLDYYVIPQKMCKWIIISFASSVIFFPPPKIGMTFQKKFIFYEACFDFHNNFYLQLSTAQNIRKT